MGYVQRNGKTGEAARTFWTHSEVGDPKFRRGQFYGGMESAKIT